MSKKDLSVVIVNYNTGSFLKECVRSAGESDLKGVEWEMVVVDNNSSDGSLAAAEDLAESLGLEVKIVRNRENIGFARANNLGLKGASGAFVLFLNPDTTLEKSSLKKAVVFMRANDDVGAVAIDMKLPSGERDEAMHRGFPTPWNAFCFFSGLARLFPSCWWFSGYTLGWKLVDQKPHEIDAGSGAFMLVRREAGDQVDWWDEDYFWNGEDLDFYFRLKQAGWKAMFLPGVRGIHYRGISSGVKRHSQALSKAGREVRERAAIASTRAMEIFYEKHYKNRYPSWVTGLVWGGVKLMQGLRRAKARWL